MQSSLAPCPCQSQKLLSACCGIYHAGTAAPTVEALMRSRYSAYALGLIDYLVITTLPAQQSLLNAPAIQAWSQHSTWLGLNVHGASVLADNIHATVDFTAHWQDATGTHQHREHSGFVKIADRWYFLDPTAGLKLGRNDPCPCGSQAKFKKCCAAWIG